jgi:hypothetical protein
MSGLLWDGVPKYNICKYFRFFFYCSLWNLFLFFLVTFWNCHFRPLNCSVFVPFRVRSNFVFFVRSIVFFPWTVSCPVKICYSIFIFRYFYFFTDGYEFSACALCEGTTCINGIRSVLSSRWAFLRADPDIP